MPNDLPSTPVVKKKKNTYILDSRKEYSDARDLYISMHDAKSMRYHATDEDVIELFRKLPDELLPILPFGYQWARPEIDRLPSVIKFEDAKTHELDMILYGPEKGKVNYIFAVDGVTSQSFSHTKNVKPPARKPPITNKDYRLVEDDEYVSYMRGHNIDHADTSFAGGKKYYSTYHPINYIPEPLGKARYWGLNMRRLLVADYRKKGDGYMQFVHYPDTPSLTLNGTPIPDFIYFYQAKIDAKKPYEDRYSLGKVYNIDWDGDYSLKQKGQTVLDYCKEFKTSKCSAPTVKIYDASLSDSDLRKQNKEIRNIVNELEEESIKALNAGRDGLFAQRACAEKEFSSCKDMCNLTLQAIKEKEMNLANASAKRAVNYGLKLLDLDTKKTLMTDDQYEKLKKKFKSEKLEDPDDSLLDGLKQIHKR